MKTLWDAWEQVLPANHANRRESAQTLLFAFIRVDSRVKVLASSTRGCSHRPVAGATLDNPRYKKSRGPCDPRPLDCNQIS